MCFQSAKVSVVVMATECGIVSHIFGLLKERDYSINIGKVSSIF